jgi:hypothetical protein
MFAKMAVHFQEKSFHATPSILYMHGTVVVILAKFLGLQDLPQTL